MARRDHATLAVMFDPHRFPARDREVMLLQISGSLGVEYTLPQHKVFSRNAGMTDPEIQAGIERDYGRTRCLDSRAITSYSLSDLGPLTNGLPRR